MQAPLEWNTQFDFEHRCEDRPFAKYVPDQPAEATAYTNVDVTLTVDPMRSAMWIREEDGRKSAYSMMRGAIKDRNGLQRALGAIYDTPSPPVNFEPTSHMLDRQLKFTPRCVNNSTWGRSIGRGPRAGQLPVVSQLIWDDRLSDKVDWAVDRDVWTERRFQRDRRFDCSGKCR